MSKKKTASVGNNQDTVSIPSILDGEAAGGENPQRGLKFQDQSLLALIPKWLARSGFTSVIREHYGDSEALFFAPGHGYVKEFAEAKNYKLTPMQFWAEIDRFKQMSKVSDGYQWFRLISLGLSEELKPLKNALRRVRAPYEFYKDEVLADREYSNYEAIALALGKDAETARFLYSRVLLDDDANPNLEYGSATFQAEAARYLPGFEEVPLKTAAATYENLAKLVLGRLNSPISRIEIENALRSSLPPSSFPPSPILLHTKSGDEGAEMAVELPWTEFFGGASRVYPPSEQWDKIVIGQLRDTFAWAKGHRTERRLRLVGGRRLSAAIAVGSVFSAVSGFAIDVEHRGETWATDDHPDAQTPGYDFDVSRSGPETGEVLVVGIGIGGSIEDEVRQAAATLGLTDVPHIYLTGPGPVVSPQHANRAATNIKALMRDELLRRNASFVHLFYKGPSHLAVFIGHRSNAVANAGIQCYEWSSPGTFSRACTITG